MRFHHLLLPIALILLLTPQLTKAVDDEIDEDYDEGENFTPKPFKEPPKKHEEKPKEKLIPEEKLIPHENPEKNFFSSSSDFYIMMGVIGGIAINAVVFSMVLMVKKRNSNYKKVNEEKDEAAIELREAKI